MTRNLVYSTISNGSAALMLLLAAIAGRALGVADFGVFGYAIAVATIAEAFMDLGLHQITIRAIARDPTDAGRMFSTSLVLKTLPGMLTVLAFTTGVYLLRPEPAVRLSCVLLLGSAVMRSYLLTARGILLGLERFGHDAFLVTLDRAVLLIACGLALWRGASVVQVSLVFLLARIVTTAVALVSTRRHVGNAAVDRDLLASLPAEAMPVGAFLFILVVYNRVDAVMLGSLKGNIDTGLYNAAYQLYEGATYGAAVISSVLTPRLSRLWSADRSSYGRLVRHSIGAAAMVAAAVAAIGWPLATFGLRVVYGADYDAAATTVQILLLGLPFIYVIWVLHAVALSAFRTSVLLKVTMAATLVNVALNFALIPVYSYNGAAAATVLSELVVMALLGWTLRGPARGRNMAISRSGDLAN